MRDRGDFQEREAIANDLKDTILRNPPNQVSRGAFGLKTSTPGPIRDVHASEVGALHYGFR